MSFENMKFFSACFAVFPVFYQVFCWEVYQSSYWNSDNGALAFDNDTDTCFTSGIEPTPWLKVELDNKKLISSLTFQGLQAGDYRIRVGDYNNNLGDGSSDIDQNTLCTSFQHSGNIGLITVHCLRELEGKYVTLQRINPKSPGRGLQLCEMTF
ncbi:uncharacterized protein LOC106153695 [Lingula anatina]|uniref:Uncharacterized protein LOC106153695 n=1 Tax=Lingula anatina TaxID=7574 RepID=A0A1S3HCD9_LINAN|nr:uncharacterized protein LOC106153695 [Lingula anatina]|eukprot:XP_013383176.1 uncharacterized protein LOC106153695 [Lingula anatina]